MGNARDLERNQKNNVNLEFESMLNRCGLPPTPPPMRDPAPVIMEKPIPVIEKPMKVAENTQSNSMRVQYDYNNRTPGIYWFRFVLSLICWGFAAWFFLQAFSSGQVNLFPLLGTWSPVLPLILGIVILVFGFKLAIPAPHTNNQ
jgi:hypothetical protein